MKDIHRKTFIRSVVLIELCCSIHLINCDDVLQRTVGYERRSRQCNDKDCGKNAGAVTSAPGMLPCARRCTNGGNCLGFSVDEDENCFLYEDCSAQADCLDVAWQPPANFHIKAGQVEKACKNDGLWNNKKKRCGCRSGWAGTYCDRPVGGCVDVPRYALSYNGGRQWIDITLPGTGRVLNVYCDIFGTFTRTMVLRTSGHREWDIPWEDYVGGRYKAIYNYWAGLDRLHELTEAGYNSLTFQVWYKSNTRHVKNYEGFHVGGSSTDYALTISESQPVSGGAFTNQYGDVLGDCLGPVNGTKFSAPDHDRDLDPENCAAKAKRGWWFKDCNFTCNPLGLLDGAGDDALLLPGLDFKDSNYTDLFLRLDVYFTHYV